MGRRGSERGPAPAGVETAIAGCPRWCWEEGTIAIVDGPPAGTSTPDGHRMRASMHIAHRPFGRSTSAPKPLTRHNLFPTAGDLWCCANQLLGQAGSDTSGPQSWDEMRAGGAIEVGRAATRARAAPVCAPTSLFGYPSRAGRLLLDEWQPALPTPLVHGHGADAESSATIETGPFGQASFGPSGASIEVWSRTSRTSRTLNCAREDAAGGRCCYAWPRTLP